VRAEHHKKEADMAIKLTREQVFPPVGIGILMGTRPNTIYGADGKPTDTVDGIRCDVRALPDLSPVSVKVPGAKAPVSNEDIEASALTGHFTWVTFDGFSGTQWVDRRNNNTIRVSGTATSVRIVPAPLSDDAVVDIS